MRLADGATVHRDLADIYYVGATQDPNLPEPMQVYRYAPEVDELTIPVIRPLEEGLEGLLPAIRSIVS